MSVHHLPAAPVVHVLTQAADPVSYGFTPARAWASAAALLAVAAAVIGGLALRRFVRRIGNGGRTGAMVALASGLVAVVNGVLNLAVADGGPGSGNGVVGGGAAVVLGVAAIGLGAAVLVRARRPVG